MSYTNWQSHTIIVTKSNHEQDYFCNAKKNAVDNHNCRQGKSTLTLLSAPYTALVCSQLLLSLPALSSSLSALFFTCPAFKLLSVISKSFLLSTPCIDFSDKLGKNSKLNSNEQKHHLKNNLYLYCGLKNYKVNQCPRKQLIKV